MSCSSGYEPDVFKDAFYLVLPPLPRRVPGEGPDCHVPKEIGGFGADSGPDPGGSLSFISVLALSASGMRGVWQYLTDRLTG